MALQAGWDGTALLSFNKPLMDEVSSNGLYPSCGFSAPSSTDDAAGGIIRYSTGFRKTGAYSLKIPQGNYISQDGMGNEYYEGVLTVQE